jgi:hypothetical protein
MPETKTKFDMMWKAYLSLLPILSAGWIIEAEGPKHGHLCPAVVWILSPLFVVLEVLVACQTARDWSPGSGEPAFQGGKFASSVASGLDESKQWNGFYNARR